MNVSARAWRWLLGSNLHPDIWRQALRSQDDTPRSPAAELYKVWFIYAVIWIINLANRDLKALNMGVDLDADESDDPPKGATKQASLLRDLPPFIAAQMLLLLLYDEHKDAYEVLIRWNTCSIDDIIRDTKLPSEDIVRKHYELAIEFLMDYVQNGFESLRFKKSKLWSPSLKNLEHPAPPNSGLLKGVLHKYERRIRQRSERDRGLAQVAREFELTVEENPSLDSVLGALYALFPDQPQGEKSLE
ncbi:hypothetical protein [Paludisphaera rhizosphaerae]|uniref:hypothetical protein n=1 Tax=Paludisphaera rhizosphaerae TaxID=2711216 RepID=UPI0013ED0503|nr:hypothetical protein [Paludisphaera rhizosphaerae]